MFSRTAIAALLTSTAYAYAPDAYAEDVPGSLTTLILSTGVPPIATGTSGEPFQPTMETQSSNNGCVTDYNAEGVYDQCKCAFPNVDYKCASGGMGPGYAVPTGAYGAKVYQRRHAHGHKGGMGMATGVSHPNGYPIPTSAPDAAGPPGGGRADCYMFTQGKTPDDGPAIPAVQIPCWTIGAMDSKPSDPAWSLAGSWTPPSATAPGYPAASKEVEGEAMMSILPYEGPAEPSVPAESGGPLVEESAAVETPAVETPAKQSGTIY
ncbi:hypothetical protein P154DRAFT_569350 [Amniculicola lignicola CBS 123094]|uniref:Lytic polysaccharide monooxygenase n=1 Tax=Amniculicola lignicola CBS 123094 TaxID=1392246 RepID=A0A6A5X3H9_9PLEO|nr:hypothetical protein P154DRAFT_569350 [Amniculicola lignicola CBS 123094]